MQHTKKIRLATYLLLIFSLPTTEALKNIASFVAILLWVTTTSWEEKAKMGATALDFLFLSVVAGAAASSYFTLVHFNEWNGFLDVVRIFIVSWIIYREDFNEAQYRSLLIAILFSTIGSLIYSYFSGRIHPLELNSVGHVNHTAIYLAICSGLALSYVTFARTALQSRLMFMMILLILTYSTLLTSARGSILPLLLTALLMLSAKSISEKKIRYLVFIVIASSAAIYLASEMGMSFIGKTAQIANGGIGQRDRTAMTALLVFREFPFFGIGLENYGHWVNLENITELANKYGIAVSQTLPNSGHAHSLYGTFLAERGIVGFAPILLLLGYWAVQLLRQSPVSFSSYETDYIAWGGALSAWILVSIGGIFNTTLHHEHGMLSMMLFAIWAGLPRTKRQ